MNNSNQKIIFLSALLVCFTACSHKSVNKQIDNEAKQESAINNRNDLYTEAQQLIDTTPGFTVEQRQQLSALRNTTRTATDQVNDKSIKLRAVLIRALVTTKDNEEEVSVLKDRIKSLGEQRLAIMFDAISKTNVILGHTDNEKRAELMDSFFRDDGQRK